MAKFAATLVVLALWAPAVQAQLAEGPESQVIFVVRHAERDDGPTAPNSMLAPADPMLSRSGVERARALASLLRSAGIERIFATEFKRTKQTAGPTGVFARVTLTIVPAEDTNALVERILKGGAAAGPTLVVGHSNTVPAILKGLGVAEPISIPDGEYDNLFVVVRPPSGVATLVRMKY
jgi:broad specificity phosphatase PhoE